MTIQTENVFLPAYWASALVNGEWSGLDAIEAAAVKAWVAKNPQYGSCIMTSNEVVVDYWAPEPGAQLLCDMLEFTFEVVSVFDMEKALQSVRVYDNGGKTADRYTAVFMDMPERAANTVAAYGMSDQPYHPQGIGQFTSAMPGPHLGRLIKFDELPADCQSLVKAYLTPEQ